MKHFKLEEFTRSATAALYNIDNTPTEEAVHNIGLLVKSVLDPLREAWHSPIIVSSGYRCEELNARVGGAKGSYHRLGMAADIRPLRGRLDGLYDLIQYLFETGAIGITECYMDERKGYIHIAYDASGFNVWPFIES